MSSWCDVQGQPLLSSDGRVSLLVQSDGNLVLYNTQVAGRVGLSFASAIYFTATYGASPQPFSLAMTQVRGAHLRHPHLAMSHWQGLSLPCMLLRRAARRCCSTGSTRRSSPSGPATKAQPPVGWWCRAPAAVALPSSTPTTPCRDFQGAYSLAGTQQGTLPVGSVLKQVQRELQRPGNCLATLLTEKDDRGFCRAECQTVLGGHDRLPHPPVGRQPGDLCHSLRELCRPLPDLQHSAAGTARMMPALHAVSRCSTTLPSWPSTTLRHICQLCGTLPPIIRPPSAPSAWSCSK